MAKKINKTGKKQKQNKKNIQVTKQETQNKQKQNKTNIQVTKQETKTKQKQNKQIYKSQNKKQKQN